MVVALMPQDTPILFIGWILIAMYCGLTYGQSTSAYDNELTIKTVSASNSLNLSATQIGYNNKIDFSLGGTNNTIDIDQSGNGAYVGYTTLWGSGYSWGGDLDGDYNNLKVVQTCNQGSSCGGDRFEFNISGNSNDVKFYQGYHVTNSGTVLTIDDYEYGGHFTRLDIHGSNNTFLGSQRSNNSGHEHTNITYIYGDYNDVYTRQESNVDKSLSLTINNDYNDVDMIQIGHASHSATVSINGSYATSLYMLQQGGTAQTYSLSQTCNTVGGCSVSVTQGN
jgi:hypothetical protein